MFQDTLNRRDFISKLSKYSGALALGSAGIPGLAMGGETLLTDPSLKQRADSLVYIFLPGGLSQFESFNPAELKESQMGTETLKSDTGYPIAQYFPRCAKIMKHVAIIRSLKNRHAGHGAGSHIMTTGFDPTTSIANPHIGAWVAMRKGTENKTLPPVVGPCAGGFIGAKYQGAVADPRKGLEGANNQYLAGMKDRSALTSFFNKRFGLRYPHKLVESYNTVYNDALNYVSSPDLDAFLVKHEDTKTRQRYGNGIGPKLLMARRLVEKGVRVVSLKWGSWDHHSRIHKGFASLGPGLDSGFSAFIEDMHNRGLLKRTLVVLTTEFGRTPWMQGIRKGRDHWPSAGCALMAGGGVQGGMLYGKTDAQGKEIVENPVRPEDLNSTIAYAMGIDHNKETYSPSGRPFKIANFNGKPVKALFDGTAKPA